MDIVQKASTLPSLVRQSISKYIRIGLTESQIRSSFQKEHPGLLVSSIKRISLVQSERRKNHPRILSVFNFRWLVIPLESCSCPIRIKAFSCNHSVALAILFNSYEINDKTHRAIRSMNEKGTSQESQYSLSRIDIATKVLNYSFFMCYFICYIFY